MGDRHPGDTVRPNRVGIAQGLLPGRYVLVHICPNTHTRVWRVRDETGRELTMGASEMTLVQRAN